MRDLSVSGTFLINARETFPFLSRWTYLFQRNAGPIKFKLNSRIISDIYYIVDRLLVLGIMSRESKKKKIY